MHVFFPNGSIEYPPVLGGAVHRYQLVKNLVDLGCTVSTFAGDQNPLTQKHTKSAASTWKLVRNADVIYARIGESPDSASGLAAWPFRMAIPRHVPIIWECNVSVLHSCKIPERPTELIQQECRKFQQQGRRVDGAIAVTQSLQAQIQSELGIANTIWIPNASDPNTFRPDAPAPDGFSVNPERLNVAYIASFTNSHHDISIVEDAAKLIEKEGLPIDIYVFGKSISLFQEEGPECLKLHGPVSYLDLPNYLSQMQVGLALYNRNVDFGSPLKLFDYMSSGCVPFCSEATSMHEILDGEEAGYISNWTSASLVASLRQLCDNPQQVAGMRENGRRLVVERFNWRSVAEQTLSLMKSCADAREASTRAKLGSRNR